MCSQIRLPETDSDHLTFTVDKSQRRDTTVGHHLRWNKINVVDSYLETLDVHSLMFTYMSSKQELRGVLALQIRNVRRFSGHGRPNHAPAPSPPFQKQRNPLAGKARGGSIRGRHPYPEAGFGSRLNSSGSGLSPPRAIPLA